MPFAAAISAHVTATRSDPTRRYAGWKTRTYSEKASGTTDRTDSPNPCNPAPTHVAA